MKEKFKKFYNEYDVAVNIIVIFISILFTGLIIMFLKYSDYKKYNEQLSNNYNVVNQSYDKCKIDNKLLDTDMQMYREYYFENKK